MPHSSPRLAAWFAERLLDGPDAQRLLGDLDEEYCEYQRRLRSRLAARTWYWKQVLTSVWILRHRRLTPPSPGERLMPLIGLLHDVRFAFRQLLARPVFTATAVFTLALGIGATTAISSVVHAVLVAPLPYADADRILRAWAHTDDGDIRDFSFRVVEYQRLAARDDVFAAVGAEFPASFTILFEDREPRQVQARMVTPRLFEVFGTRPEIGRMFTSEEIQAGDALVTLVTHGFWRRELGARPEAVGSTLDFAGNQFELIGVLPPDYVHVSGTDVEVFIPYTIGTSRWVAHWLDLYVLRQPEVPLTAAAERINTVIDNVGQADERSRGWHATVEPLHEMIVGDVRLSVLATLGVVALVLLIACVNVANLTLAAGAARAPEFTLRTALGAGRPRLLRQVLVEHAVLAAIGAGLGLVVAAAGLRGLLAVAPHTIPRLDAARIDLPVLGVALLLTVATTLVLGTATALHSIGGRTGHQRLPRSQRPASAGRMLRTLVVAEVALALTLLVSAGLLVRTFQALQREDLGFDRVGALTFRIVVPRTRYPTPIDTADFLRTLRDGLLQLDGVTAVGAGTNLPVSGEGAVTTVRSEEQIRAGSDDLGVTSLQRRATVGFFEALGTPVLEGRSFGTIDDREAQTVAVLSASLARSLFGDEPAVGRRVTFAREPDADDWKTVIGVVGDIRYREAHRVDEPQVYQAHPQSASRDMAVVVRTAGDPADLVAPARAVIQRLDAQIPVYEVSTLEHVVGGALAARRFAMWLFSLFATVALALTIAGIYGVLSYTVGLRRGELAVRVAVGADAGHIARSVLASGMRPVIAGLVLGLGGAIVSMRTLAALLYSVSPTDPVTYLTVGSVVLVVALVASYLPARRAARIDPIESLRSE